MPVAASPIPQNSQRFLLFGCCVFELFSIAML
jgi:hypothetical protein